MMRLIPPELDIGENEGFDKEKDIFQRRQLGANIIKIFEEVEHPAVLMLDAPWGAGKTTFIKMLAGEMRKNDFIVVHFDAFANDYYDEPFAALAGEVLKCIPETDSNREKFIDTATNVGKALLKAGGKAGVRLLTLNAVDGTALEDVGNDISEAINNSADVVFKSLISEKSEKDEQISEFKNLLTKLADNKKLIFIVDELDRCRPDYSIKIIETIKHLFEAKDVHFLISCNFDQVTQSISHVYGNPDTANIYLEKFVHLKLKFPIVNDYKNEIEQYKDFIINKMNANLEDHQIDYAINFICKNFYYNNRSIRSFQRALCYFETMLYLGKPFNGYPAIIAGAIILSFKDETLYKKYINMEMPADEVIKELELKKIYEENSSEYTSMKSLYIDYFTKDKNHSPISINTYEYSKRASDLKFIDKNLICFA